MGLLDALRDVRTVKALLTAAEAEGRAAGEERHGPEHLLLAATALPDGTATRALARVGVDPARLRAAVEAAHQDALAGIGLDGGSAGGALRAPATGVLSATPQAQQVFQAAVALSKSVRPARLRGAHVVVAACDLERGTVPRALAALGVDRAELRAAARAEAGLG
ncbi:Clp protease N-terminal domain-containing protein [Blastococcus sp. SYSU D00820]